MNSPRGRGRHVAVAGLMPEVAPTEAEILADDLADVWRDLREGLMALQAGAAEADVAWEWRFGFHTHWGPHAQSALRALRARA